MKSDQQSGRRSAIYKSLMGLRGQIAQLDPSLAASLPFRMLVHFVRFIIIYVRETARHQLWQRAASLTYTTILSLFPLLIVVTSLGSVFYSEEEEEKVMSFIEDRVLPPSNVEFVPLVEEEAAAERKEQLQSIVENIRDMSRSYRESAPGVGVFGLIAFFMAAFLLYNSIEGAFEASWETGRRRTFARTLSGFTILVAFAPIIFGVSIAASSFMVKLMGEEERQAVAFQHAADEQARETAGREGEVEQAIEEVRQTLAALEQPGEVIDAPPPEAEAAADAEALRERLAELETELNAMRSARLRVSIGEPGTAPTDDTFIGAVKRFDVPKVLLGLVTPLFNSIMIALVIMLVPQRRVRLGYALLGGLFAGVLWELTKVAFFYYVYMSAMRRQLLQSLGAVPIFLIWIYFTWLVFLLGNELTYVSQNLRKLTQLYFGRRTATLLDGQIYVAMMLLAADSFARGEQGPKTSELAQRLQLSFREFETVLDNLQKQGFVDISMNNRVLLAKPPDKIPLRELLELGCDPSQLCDNTELTRRPVVERALKALTLQVMEMGKLHTLADLLDLSKPEKLAEQEAEAEAAPAT